MLSLSLPQSSVFQRLGESQIRQLAYVINLLMVVWLAWLLAQLSWQLVPEAEETAIESPRQAAPVVRKQSRINEEQIAQWHMFGVPGAAPAVKKASPVNAPETRLNLTLKGVFSSPEQKSSRAIVADPKGKEKHYSVGDPLPGGARLSQIHADRIILERGGRFETLRLPRKLTTASGSRQVSHRSSTAVSANQTRQATAFTQYRDEIKQNPTAFLNYVRASPARKNGKFIGFRLQPGKQRGAMQELGLKPGDIVTAINGVEIDSPAKGMKAMQSLGKGDSVNVTLLRNGQETSMSLALPVQ